MKKSMIILMALTMCISFVGVVNATLVTQNFENLPNEYLYSGGNQNLGNYLQGLSFSSDVTVMDSSKYLYNDITYPPHSGTAIIGSVTQSAIRVDFLTPTNHVEAYYSSASLFYLEAYNLVNQRLNPQDTASPSNLTEVLVPHTLGTITTYSSTWVGDSSLISVNSGSMDIAYVIFHDNGNHYSLDDLAYNVPEPATMAILGLGGLFCARLKRR